MGGGRPTLAPSSQPAATDTAAIVSLLPPKAATPLLLCADVPTLALNWRPCHFRARPCQVCVPRALIGPRRRKQKDDNEVQDASFFDKNNVVSSSLDGGSPPQHATQHGSGARAPRTASGPRCHGCHPAQASGPRRPSGPGAGRAGGVTRPALWRAPACLVRAGVRACVRRRGAGGAWRRVSAGLTHCNLWL